MGFFFLYIAFLEQIVGGLFDLISDSARRRAGYMPKAIFDRLMSPTQYDLEAQRQAVQQAVDAGRTAPVFMDTSNLILISLTWTLVFVAAAFVLYDRRDL